MRWHCGVRLFGPRAAIPQPVARPRNPARRRRDKPAEVPPATLASPLATLSLPA
jgi:hypothetical protein